MLLLFSPRSTDKAKHEDRLSSRLLGRWSYAVMLGMLGACCALAANGNGGLTGLVVDDSGHAVAGARVLINHAPFGIPPALAPPVITGPTAAMAVTDSGGSFQASNLLPGPYIACAETIATGLLDPCHWSASAPVVTVSPG